MGRKDGFDDDLVDGGGGTEGDTIRVLRPRRPSALAPHSHDPPPGTRVWMGLVNDPNTRVAHSQSSALAIEPTKPIAYFATLSLGYFLFQAFGTLPVQDGGSGPGFPILDPPPPLDGALTNI
jgi:hypothetical protein